MARLCSDGGAFRWLVVGGAACALLGIALPAAAADDKTVNEQILEILRQKGEIDDARYEELKEQAEAEAAAKATPPVSAGEEKKAWDYGWKNGFYLKNADGSVKLKFGGRIQLDGAVINVSRNLDQAIGGNGDGTGVEVRRARIFTEGTVYDYGIFKFQYDFAGGGTNVKDLWVGLQKLPGLGKTGNVRVGHMKEPFSIEQMTSSKYITFMERALPDVFVPGRNTGLMAQRTFADERVYVGAGAFVNTNDMTGNGFGNFSHYNVSGRVTGLPIYVDQGRKLLHLGLNYSHQFQGGGGTDRYRERPEAHLSQRFVDTGTLMAVKGVDKIGGEIAGVFGPAHFQGEMIGNYINKSQTSGGSGWMWGFYGQAGYFLTGESRAYKPATASFARTSPRHNFSIKDGTWGAWEIAGRYSYLDLDDRGASIRGGTLQDLTAGLNWYLFPNLRLMTNYVYSWRAGDGNGSIVEGRVAFDF